MDRERLEREINASMCIKGGTKEACIKARDVLNNMTSVSRNTLQTNTAVDMLEFIQAVETLITYAAMREDEKVDLYRCDSDCALIYCLYCPGRLAASDNGTRMCPYYSPEDK